MAAIEALREYEMEEKELFKTIYKAKREKKAKRNGKWHTFYWTMKMLEHDGIVSVEYHGRAPNRVKKISLSTEAEVTLKRNAAMSRVQYARVFGI